MEIPPRFKSSPLSAVIPIMQEMKPGYPVLWVWTELWENSTRPYSAEEAAQLARDGWKREESISILQSQLYHSIRFTHESGEQLKEGWYYGQEGEPAPVVLAFSIASNPPPAPIHMLNPLPLPQHGEYALITERDAKEVASYHILELPALARQRWVTLNEAIIRLSEPLKWPQFTLEHKLASNEIEYQTQIHALKSKQKIALPINILNDVVIDHVMSEAAHRHVEELRAALLKPDWLEQWQEVQRMARELAHDYYDYHQKKQRSFTPPLPAITSGQHTTFPSNNHFRGIAQSFGPHVARSLWNTEDNREQQLTTPNNSSLVARGENEHEQKALHSFIEGGMGVEGIKYMATLLSAYHAQTGAINRKDDARVTLRQLLMYMGRENHADDLDEQRKLMYYILYLSRTWVTALEKGETRTKRGRPPSVYREYTPLIVLEGLKSDERGGISIPDEIEFHLGKEFWDQMFGGHKHFFTLPTALILSYHSVRQQQEICLALYLSNMINLNHGRYAVHFPTLLIETGMQGQETIEQGHDRTRDALRVIYALEQLEKDSLIIREPHIDVDTILATELYLKTGNKQEEMSEASLSRVYNSYRHFQAMSVPELRSRRRIATKRLLDTVKDNSIAFKSGTLINGQIEKRIQSTQLATERREQAQKAARAPHRKKKQ